MKITQEQANKIEKLHQAYNDSPDQAKIIIAMLGILDIDCNCIAIVDGLRVAFHITEQSIKK